MNVPKDTELQRMRRMVKYIRTDPELIADMEKSNEVSHEEGEVDHGWDHAKDCAAFTLLVAREANRLIPGTFTEQDILVAEASALQHDRGRRESVKDHDKLGAVMAHHYLLQLARKLFGSEDACPRSFRVRVVSNIRRHRADSWLYHSEHEKKRRARELTDPAMSALLLGDKLCGSESRVPACKLAFMQQVERIKLPRGFRRRHNLDPKWSLARINWGFESGYGAGEQDLLAEAHAILKQHGIEIPEGLSIDAHDRVNGSIKKRVVEMYLDDCPSTAKVKGTFLYRLTVDERRAPQDLVTGLDWWADAFHVSAKAAKHLGFRFQIEFNGRMLHYHREPDTWMPVKFMQV